MDNKVIYVSVIIIAVILFLNLIKVFINIFTTPKAKEKPNPLRDELRAEIDKSIKPHLTSLEGIYEKSHSGKSSFSSFVLSTFKDKFSRYSEKDEKLLESEVTKCCSDYESAECKESFCLESSGISCPK